MPHAIEETGINCLIEHLRNAGHVVNRRAGTFDLEVDGQLAEVKAKDKLFGKIDFISLTDKQYQAGTQRILRRTSSVVLKVARRNSTKYEPRYS